MTAIKRRRGVDKETKDSAPLAGELEKKAEIGKNGSETAKDKIKGLQKIKRFETKALFRETRFKSPFFPSSRPG